MKKTHLLQNLTSGVVLLSKLHTADTFFDRFRGLMGKTLKESEGLWIKPCNSIHCFFMKVPIDVLFLDKEDQVIHKIDSMKPWRVSPIIQNAKSVIEGSAGAFSKVRKGDRISIQSKGQASKTSVE